MQGEDVSFLRRCDHRKFRIYFHETAEQEEPFYCQGLESPDAYQTFLPVWILHAGIADTFSGGG